jgi:ribosome-associated protein
LPRTVARRAALLAADKQAIDIIVLDVRKVTDFADFFVICTGAVNVHVQAIADHIERGLRGLGYKPLHTEGAESQRWVLLDYVDIVIHVFQPEARGYYSLERLWGDAPRLTIKGIGDERPSY